MADPVLTLKQNVTRMSAHGKPWAMALAKVMTDLRSLKQMGLREHARALEINPATLSRIERGFGCDTDQLVTIQQKTGFSFDALLGRISK
jgi:hypothetical protein